MRKRWSAVVVLTGIFFVRDAIAQEPPPDDTPSPPPIITIVPPPNQQPQTAPPAQTQQRQQPPPPPQAEDDGGERQGLSNFGIGFAYAANLKGSAGTKSATGYGLVLEFGRTVPLTEQLDFGLRLALGLTEWERFTKWAKAGYDVGAWTTEAYEDTYNWTRKHSGAPSTHGLRILGAGFAFLALSIGYVVAGVAYATAVFAPTTFLETDLTANYNFADFKDLKSKKGVNPYLKGGLGMMAFIHPDHGTLLGALGPTFGAGVRLGGGLHLGMNVTWSPPPLHGEARGGSTHIVTSGLTIGVQN